VGAGDPPNSPLSLISTIFLDVCLATRLTKQEEEAEGGRIESGLQRCWVAGREAPLPTCRARAWGAVGGAASWASGSSGTIHPPHVPLCFAQRHSGSRADRFRWAQGQATREPSSLWSTPIIVLLWPLFLSCVVTLTTSARLCVGSWEGWERSLQPGLPAPSPGGPCPAARGGLGLGQGGGGSGAQGGCASSRSQPSRCSGAASSRSAPRRSSARRAGARRSGRAAGP
jgi:hypothetical protein